MKSFLILASMLFTSLASAKPLAFVKESGGFCPGRCPASAVSIEDTGLVVAEVQRFVPTPTVERKVLLVLSKDLVRAIKKDIQSVNAGGDLIDLQDGEPICMDIPQLDYTVVKDGQNVAIGQDRNCHKYRRADYQGTQLADILQNFLTLHNYSQR